MEAPASREGVTYTLGKPILQVKDVHRTLGGNAILREVNAEIRDIQRQGSVTGQVVAFLGPSGVGKTTLFRLLAGLDEPDRGQVLIGEEALPVRRGMVGVVAQHYPLFAHRTILGNLVVAGRRAGLSAAAATDKARAFLHRFGLEGKEKSYPIELSGGQRQRVAIAQQFMCSENFLLMDEPFSGLDPLAKEKVVDLIAEVASLHELNTIVVVTHDIVAGLEVADMVWLMGRERDRSGVPIPGANIRATYNLADIGLAWRKGISNTPEFLDLAKEVREKFHEL